MSWKAKIAAGANRLLRPFDLELGRVSESTDAWCPLSQIVHPAPGPLVAPFSGAFIKAFQGRAISSAQEPADFAVVMQTTLRPKLADAIQSVFDQKFNGSVQLLLGIDIAGTDPVSIDKICRSVPDRHSVLVFYPGYSTS